MKLEEFKNYNKKNIEIEDIELGKFERIELLIFLINYLKINSGIDDYYLILGGRGLISRHSFNNGDYLVQNARIILKTINQKKVYSDELCEYENDDENIERLYIREGNAFVKIKDANKKVKFKEELYLKLLSLDIKYKLPDINYAFQDNKRYGIIIEDKVIEIDTINIVKPTKLAKCKKKSKGDIKVDISDLVIEAEEIDEILNSKQKYRKKVIENNIVKEFKAGEFHNTNSIIIKNVTNIVGQVAAGKSTFSEALVKNISKQKKKILIIESTVRKVLDRSHELEQVGISVSPVIGGSSWQEHIEKSNNAMDYLSDYDSRILTSGCILGGFIKDCDVSIKYGSEPCKKIYKFNEIGENKNTIRTKSKYKCPFYYSCAKTKREKNIIDSDVIVTTTAALINTPLGISGMTLFQFALENIDLIIVDEAESELQKADTIFAPIISYDEYIRNNGEISSKHHRKELSERIDKGAEDTQKYISLHNESSVIFTKIHQILKNNKQGIAKSYLKTPFTASMLIKKCEAKKLLPLEIIRELMKMVGFKVSILDEGMIRCITEIKNKKALYDLFNGYGKTISGELSLNEANTIIFIISVLYFERLYRKISNLVEGNNILPMSTKDVLSQRFEFQQRYIPVSPKGNIFALQYKEKAELGKADLYIVKQFAMGRSMYLRFPWLKVNSKGEPLGANVLLLSGSSYAPLSFSNHINEPVNYIIEAEEYKRDFISKSHFEYIDMGVSVSGSGNNREENLQKLVSECKELILDKLEDREDNILIIVNSYRDAEITMNQLKYVLRDTVYKDDIMYLISDSDFEDNERIKQSKVSEFSSKKARVLIAPAILIERGHNIVDFNGNAAFGTLMFLTRPMGNPDNYSSHVPKVNGKIMSGYSKTDYYIDTVVFSDMRKKANMLYNSLDSTVYNLSQLSEEIQDDIVVTLFVMLLQIFGRLCRVGNEETIKDNAPEVYFLDAAFKSSSDSGFDFLNKLIEYLDRYMESTKLEGEVLRTLYGPFYNAIKKGRNIYGKR